MDTSEYKDLYVSESFERISKLNKLLVALEKTPQDKALLDEIFREAHTLKGMAASMGYDDIVRLSHSMESALVVIRGNPQKTVASTVSLLFETLDLLEALTGDIASAKGTPNGEKTIGISLLQSKINSIAERLDSLCARSAKEGCPKKESSDKSPFEQPEAQKIIEAAAAGMLVYKVTFTIDRDCQQKIARAFVVLKNFQDFGQVFNYDSVCALFKNGDFGRHFGFFFMSKAESAKVKERISLIQEVESIEIELVTASDAGETVPLPLVPDGENNRGRFDKQEVQTTIRVSVEKISRLMNLAGEFVTGRNRLINAGASLNNEDLDAAIAQINRLTADLQDEMVEMRLVPLACIFDHFPRMVRDIARNEGKKVDLQICGSEIGLDRIIVDEINDLLVHILRNAVNHGIERPEDRKKKGKPETGRIKLHARKERSLVFIEVADDGQGIDSDEIKKVALQKNIISSADAEKLGRDEALSLICAPGFSTADEITEISGRGVGMNTVKSKVESFGGSLTIEAIPGMGSKFTMRLPVSITISKSLLVKVAAETFAIPMTNIVETIKVAPVIIKSMEHHEVIPYRDEVLPLVDLKKRFSYAGGEDKRGDKFSSVPVVVVESGNKRAGLIVDNLLGQQEIVIKSLTGKLRNMRGLAGATIMGDGRVALIVDIPSVL